MQVTRWLPHPTLYHPHLTGRGCESGRSLRVCLCISMVSWRSISTQWFAAAQFFIARNSKYREDNVIQSMIDNLPTYPKVQSYANPTKALLTTLLVSLQDISAFQVLQFRKVHWKELSRTECHSSSRSWFVGRCTILLNLTLVNQP